MRGGRRIGSFAPAAVFVVALAGCGGGGGEAIPDECNPLGGFGCVTPFPSSLYQVEDSSTESGMRNDIPLGALPINQDGRELDPAQFNRLDGFGAGMPMITVFETGVDDATLPPWTDIGASLEDSSPTIVVDMETGELVPHFAEVDVRAADTPTSQALFIRPAVILEGGRRYAVAIKKTLKARDGSELPVSDGFQSILDGTETNHPLLERARPRYDAIFSALEAHGVGKDDLVVAWDFTTISRRMSHADILDARDVAMPQMGVAGENLTYEITSEDATPGEGIARKVTGEFDSPLFLTQDGEFTPITTLARGGDGKPMMMGMYRAPFQAIIPECARASAEPVPIVIYGHGLLGTMNQVSSGSQRALATDKCMILYGTSFRGFSSDDISNLALALNDANKADLFFPVQVQGVIDHIALTQAAIGPMAEDLFVNDQGASLVDPDMVYYYGLSQGGIMGGTIVAFDPVIERGVLGVGAVNYSMLLDRSLDWPTYEVILKGAYPDPLDVNILIGLYETLWVAEPVTTVHDLLTGGIPGTPPKQVLLQIAGADDEVTNIASYVQARTMGIPMVGPTVYEPWGVEIVEGSPVENGIVLYDYGLLDTIPEGNEPPPENSVHGWARTQQATLDQIDHFFATGEIVNFCDGACACDTGACGERL